MRKFNYLSLILLLTFLLTVPSNIVAKEKDKKGNRRSLTKTAQGPAQSVININGITSWVGSDGYHDWVVASSWNGAYPKGTGVGSVFAEGIEWGGKVNDGQTPLIRVNGNDYGTGCQSVFDVPRVYRVRPDFQSGSLTDDAASFFDKSLGSVSEGDINTIKAQYEADWLEWPVDRGAPYLDADSNGVYDPDPNGNGIYGEEGEDVPGIPAASQTLFIAYDDALSATLYQCPPIGLEIHETYWSYAYTGALANVIYKKADLIYKGTPKSSPNSVINDFYFVQWCDPDVGTSSDDFMGCDTSLNMGFAYNSRPEDATYGAIGLAPAAIGYDYLQGVSAFTGNPNDSAIFNLQWRKGYKYVNSKPMSSAIYYAAGGTWGDPDYNYQGALEYYNYMQGLKPDGTPFPDEVRDEIPGVGTYLLAGDPVAGTGKLDGHIDTPGDRRLLVINGPVNIRLGDTAEVVIALVGGLGGADNLENVTRMKTNDKTAQIVFDQLFKLPTMPPPEVKIAQLDNKLILNWGGNSSLSQKIESFTGGGYNFEGYEVYQLKTASSDITKPEEAVKLATFDLVDGITTILDTVEEAGVLLPTITAVGTDKGVQRYLEVTKTAFRSNQPLRNGQEYYFAVVAYGFNPSPLLPFHALRSKPVAIVGVPQSPNPGFRFTSSSGDTLKPVEHTGPSDGAVVPLVVDPTRTTGHQYRVSFANNSEGVTTWSVTDVSTGAVLVSNETNQQGPGEVDEAFPVVDGIEVKVVGPPVGMKTWTIPNGARRFSPVGGALFGLEGFSNAGDPEAPQNRDAGTMGAATNFLFGSIGTTLGPTEYHDVLLKFAAVDTNLWDPTATPTDENFSRGYRYLRSAGDPAKPEFAPWIVNVGSGYPYQDYNFSIPFSAWDMETNPPTRLAIGHLENNQPNGLVDGRYWPGLTDIDNGAADGPREMAFIFSTPYTDTPDTTYTINFLGSVTPLMWVITCARRNDPPWPGGDEFEILANNVNAPEDVFTYTAPNVTQSSDLAKVDVERINVFPNPYYASHYRELSRDAKYVTFSHLPNRATIRIFDLAGVMVRTIEHNNSNPATSQRTTWDLKNNDNYPVASGIYIIHIDMPDMGVTKVLKLAVVQEEQILKVY